jgi:D-glycero-alpha-D-manno-heptose 1-phosphate guanylyltransferase
MPGKFSFETDLLVPHVTDIKPCAFPTPGVFIDIGVPEDYARAQTLLEARHRGHAHSSS